MKFNFERNNQSSKSNNNIYYRGSNNLKKRSVPNSFFLINSFKSNRGIYFVL